MWALSIGGGAGCGREHRGTTISATHVLVAARACRGVWGPRSGPRRPWRGRRGAGRWQARPAASARAPTSGDEGLPRAGREPARTVRGRCCWGPQMIVALEGAAEADVAGQVTWELVGESFARPVIGAPVGAEVVIKNVSKTARTLVAAEDAKLIPAGPINPTGPKSFRVDRRRKVYTIGDKDAPHLKGNVVVVDAPFVATVDEAGQVRVRRRAGGQLQVADLLPGRLARRRRLDVAGRQQGQDRGQPQGPGAVRAGGRSEGAGVPLQDLVLPHRPRRRRRADDRARDAAARAAHARSTRSSSASWSRAASSTSCSPTTRATASTSRARSRARPEIVSALEAASGADRIDEARMKQVRDVGESVMKTIQGSRKPDFAMLIDRARPRGRARAARRERVRRRRAPGRPLVDDALAGYLRDDLWAHNGTMYFVSAAPVIKRDPPVAYVGAIVLGHQVTNALAQKLVSSLDVEVGFYPRQGRGRGQQDARGRPQADARRRAEARRRRPRARLPGEQAARRCRPARTTTPRSSRACPARRRASNALLRGVRSSGRRRSASWARSRSSTRATSSFGNFPWLLVGGGFLLIARRRHRAHVPRGRSSAAPARPRTRCGSRRARPSGSSEDGHGGKFGSIARSVNIHIDKLGRDAKTAKKDLDQLLGPAPEGSLGTIDLLATALPAVRPGGPAPRGHAAAVGVPVQRSRPGVERAPDRRRRARRRHPPVQAGATARRRRSGTPTAVAADAARSRGRASRRPLLDALDDDILGGAAVDEPRPCDPYFKQVFDQFVAVKKSCGEPTSGLTYRSSPRSWSRTATT